MKIYGERMGEREEHAFFPKKVRLRQTKREKKTFESKTCWKRSLLYVRRIWLRFESKWDISDFIVANCSIDSFFKCLQNIFLQNNQPISTHQDTQTTIHKQNKKKNKKNLTIRITRTIFFIRNRRWSGVIEETRFQTRRFVLIWCSERRITERILKKQSGVSNTTEKRTKMGCFGKWKGQMITSRVEVIKRDCSKKEK